MPLLYNVYLFSSPLYLERGLSIHFKPYFYDISYIPNIVPYLSKIGFLKFWIFFNKSSFLNAFPISEVNMGIMNTSPIMEIEIQKA